MAHFKKGPKIAAPTTMQPNLVFISRDLEPGSLFAGALAERGLDVSGRSLVVLQPLPFESVPVAGWIFFASRNAVHFFFRRLSELDMPLPAVRWAALGAATAVTLSEYVAQVDFTGNGDPEETAARFRQLAGGARVLFPAARRSMRSIPELLAGSCTCLHLDVYDNTPVSDPQASDAGILVFTSPMNAECYFGAFPLKKGQQVVAIGRTTAAALEKLGVGAVAIADKPTEPALAEAVLRLRS
ncbi:MAG: uroporphyrinogen-III synthase [Saprospiraceae bacterium]